MKEGSYRKSRERTCFRQVSFNSQYRDPYKLQSGIFLGKWHANCLHYFYCTDAPIVLSAFIYYYC